MRSSPILALVALCAACNDETLTDDALVVTAVAVSPDDFLGDLPCGRLDGGPVVYVATFTDAAGTVLGSSPPVSCLLPVAFERVRVGNEYFAEVDVYVSDDVRPQAFASRTMIDGAGATVTPAATSRCVRTRNTDGTFSEGGAIASLNNRVYLRGCETIVLEAGESSVVVDPRVTLGGRACDDESRPVERFVVTPDGGNFPPTQIPCGGDPVRYTPAVAGQAYGFRVDAYAPGASEPSFARCNAVARQGLPVLATCDGLSSSGNVTVDLGPVFSGAMLACDTQVGRVRIAAGDADPTTGATIPCSGPTLLGPFPAGAWTARFVADKPDGSFLAAGACTATVVAGETATSTCALP